MQHPVWLGTVYSRQALNSPICLPGVGIKGASYHQACLLRFALFMYVQMSVFLCVLVTAGSEDGVGPRGVGVIPSRCRCWELNWGPLQEYMCS